MPRANGVRRTPPQADRYEKSKRYAESGPAEYSMMKLNRIGILFLGFGLLYACGCAVPQPRGIGLYRHVQEPRTKAWYHLYLPVDYVRNNGAHPDGKSTRWPLVMTFHGMKPYDNARPQEREWEQQADIYGYIVCAPELHTSDSFMEYPLTKEHSYVLRDRNNVLAIMEHVFATTLADRDRVLSTSWSCGGYLAHYFPNRYPEKFSCIATRLSNFSPQLMIEETVPRCRDRVPVAIFIGDGDFPACKTESEDAVAWYQARRFRVVRGKMIDHMGHERIPQTAAAFFAEQCGIKPLRPIEAAATLAKVQMTEYHPTQQQIAAMAPRTRIGREALARADRRADDATGPVGRASRNAPIRPRYQTSDYATVNAGRNYPPDATPEYDPSIDSAPPVRRVTRDTPPSGAGATRVAARATGGNMLEPIQLPGAGNDAPSERESPKAAPIAAPVAATQNDPRLVQPGDRPSARTRRGDPLPETDAVASAEPTRPPPIERPPQRDFQPSSAGPSNYDLASAREAVQAKLPRRTSAERSGSVARGDVPQTDVSRRAPSGTPHRLMTSSVAERSRQVPVKLSGPAIGRAPHWIGYSVELDPSKLVGADFLWMDNGVWIGDEPRGVKILNDPGLHKISVLVVAKDNTVYRGCATVQVLDSYPSTHMSAMRE